MDIVAIWTNLKKLHLKKIKIIEDAAQSIGAKFKENF